MGLASKRIESKAQRARNYVKKNEAKGKEAKVKRDFIMPAAPDYFDARMAEDWGSTGQSLADNKLLLPSRVAYLEQYCVLRARIRAEGIEAPAGIHSTLKSVTAEMWKPAFSLESNDEQNQFIDI